MLADIHDNNYAKVSIQKNKYFLMELSLIKDMPIRYWSVKDKSWFIPIFDLGLLSRKTKKTPYKLQITDELKEKYQQYIANIKDILKIKKISNETFIKDMDVLAINLYPFQTVGAYYLYKAQNAILGDSVGLGKTIMALAVVERWFNEVRINSTLVLCPSTLKRNWENEIKRFTERSTIVISGDKPKRKQQYKQAYKYDFIVISYDTLFRDYEDLIKPFILDKNFYFTLIMDELQSLKNSSAKRTKFSKLIAKNAKYRLGLSATPIENGIMDLYNVYQVIDNKIFGDGRLYEHFKNRYCILDYWGGIKDIKNRNIIIKRMKHVFIKRFKEDVSMQLPKRIENNYWIQLSDAQRSIYNDIKKKIIDEINDEKKAKKVRQANALAMIMYLRQVCLSAKLLGVADNISTKTDFLLDFIKSLDNRSKIVIFVHFKMMLQLLKNSLIDAGYNILTITASDKIDDRFNILDKFNNNKNTKILLTGDVLTEGVNIPSANYSVNFDMLFNPAKMEQRNGRIDRLDNKHKTLNIINFIAENTIEERMFEILENKRKLYKSIIDQNKVEGRLTLNNIGKLL